MLFMKDRIYKSSNHSVYSCKNHIIWCPKFRRPVLTDGIDLRLKEIIAEVCTELEVELISVEVMPDHVHLLVNIPPKLSIQTLVGFLKGRSSRILRSEFPKLKSRLPTLWTRSYFVSSVGGISVKSVKRYIEEQKGV